MKEKFLVLENIISKTYFEQLIDNIFDYNWRFSSNLTYDDDKNHINHLDLEHGFNAKLTESQRYFILPTIFKICDLSGIKITDKNQVERIIPRIQTMMSSNNQINDIHVDKEENHYVIIFYPHNIDGETIIYNETTLDLSYSKYISMNPYERKEATKNFSVLKKISPRENTAVVFNGKRYHASSSPNKGPRCIININIDMDLNSKSRNTKSLNYQ